MLDFTVVGVIVKFSPPVSKLSEH